MYLSTRKYMSSIDPVPVGIQAQSVVARFAQRAQLGSKLTRADLSTEGLQEDLIIRRITHIQEGLMDGVLELELYLELYLEHYLELLKQKQTRKKTEEPVAQRMIPFAWEER